MPVSIGTIIQASYYNSLQTIVLGILGPAGYNQTLASAQLSSGAIVTSGHWNNLRTDLNAIQTIQAGSPFSSATLPAIVTGTIIYAATINLYDAAVATVQAGYAGNLILVNNAFSDTRTASWPTEIDDEVTISFADATASEYFFSTNGELRLALSQTTNANTTDAAWVNNAISIGTVVFNKSTTTRTGTGGTPLAIGWNNLTTSYQTIFSGVNLVVNSYYSNDSVYVYAKKTASGNGVTIRTRLVNGGGTGVVSGSTKATWGYKKAVSAGTPAFAFEAPNNFDDNATGGGTGTTLPTITSIANFFAARSYVGNGSSLAVTTGVDVSGTTSTTGGLLWLKSRSNVSIHMLQSPLHGNGANSMLSSNDTGAYSQAVDTYTASPAGFTINGLDGNRMFSNAVGQSFISWSFRRAQKFFDLVTWQGNGNGARSIPHGLGILPGMIIVKKLQGTPQDWIVWHKDLPSESTIRLNIAGTPVLNDNAIQGVTTTSFATSPGNGSTLTNVSGETYVAYVFANDTSAGSYIKTGSFNGSGSQTVNLGWEPQYLMIKGVNGPDNWQVYDSTRGFNTSSSLALYPNLQNDEASTTSVVSTSTGFTVTNASGAFIPYIWMAIRKSDPIAATSLFNAQQYTGFNHIQTPINVGFAPTLAIAMQRSANGNNQWSDITRGGNNLLRSNDSSIEFTYPNTLSFTSTGIVLDLDNFSGSWNSTYPVTLLTFKSSPDFYDQITWSGATSNINLGWQWTAAPRMMIIKCRSGGANISWCVWHADIGNKLLYSLNDNGNTSSSADIITPNGSTIDIPPLQLPGISQPGSTYVGYAFGSKAGISMVGSYTGDGTTSKAIACGFAAGARFVMIKNVNDTTANWRMWNYADGITSTTHMRFSMEISAAPVSDPSIVSNGTTGFTASGVMNQNGAKYIFLAIA